MCDNSSSANAGASQETQFPAGYVSSLDFKNIEERLNEEVQHPLSGYKTTYLRCIELQTRLLARYLTGRNRCIPTTARSIGGKGEREK